jgi:hypothetical protein
VQTDGHPQARSVDCKEIKRRSGPLAGRLQTVEEESKQALMSWFALLDQGFDRLGLYVNPCLSKHSPGIS